MTTRKTLAWAALALTLVACGDGLAATTTSTTMAPTTSITPGPPADPLVSAATADLAERLDVEVTEIALVWSKPVSWPDGAMGCPEPGMMYTQAIVEGHQLVLQAGDRFFDYHAGSQGDPFLCSSGAEDGGYDTAPEPPGTTS